MTSAASEVTGTVSQRGRSAAARAAPDEPDRGDDEHHRLQPLAVREQRAEAEQRHERGDGREQRGPHVARHAITPVRSRLSQASTTEPPASTTATRQPLSCRRATAASCRSPGAAAGTARAAPTS